MVHGDSLYDITCLELLRPVTALEEIQGLLILFVRVQQRLLDGLIHVSSSIIFSSREGRRVGSTRGIHGGVHWLSSWLILWSIRCTLIGQRRLLGFNHVRRHTWNIVWWKLLTVILQRSQGFFLMGCFNRTTLDVKLSLIKATVWCEILRFLLSRIASIVVRKGRNVVLFFICGIEISPWLISWLWTCALLLFKQLQLIIDLNSSSRFAISIHSEAACPSRAVTHILLQVQVNVKREELLIGIAPRVIGSSIKPTVGRRGCSIHGPLSHFIGWNVSGLADVGLRSVADASHSCIGRLHVTAAESRITWHVGRHWGARSR